MIPLTYFAGSMGAYGWFDFRNYEDTDGDLNGSITYLFDEAKAGESFEPEKHPFKIVMSF